jgi:hypothetical protein
LLSPDGRELGLFVTSKGMVDLVENYVTRIDLDDFAAHVFNATGLAHHEKRAYGRSAELFGSALFLAPRSGLFAYNLACAWARLREPRSKSALLRAIELDGEEVRARAAKDADFDAVREEPWFKETVAH